MNLNSQNQFLFFTLIYYAIIIASVNSGFVTILYLLRALHRRIIVYRIIIVKYSRHYTDELIVYRIIIVKYSTHKSESRYGHLR